MSAAWATVLAVGAGTVAAESGRPCRRRPAAGFPRASTELLEMVAPAILAALVVTETFASGRSLVARRAPRGRRRRHRRRRAARAALARRARGRARDRARRDSSAEAGEQLVRRQLGERVDDEIGLLEPVVRA